jgi:hypothetical protein
MKTYGNWWMLKQDGILILKPIKMVLNEYPILVVKMVLDDFNNNTNKLTFELLIICDIKLLYGLANLLPNLLEELNSLMKLA